TLIDLTGRRLNIALSGYEISAIFRELNIWPRAFSTLINSIKYALTGRNHHWFPQFRTISPRCRSFQMLHVLGDEAPDAGFKQGRHIMFIVDRISRLPCRAIKAQDENAC